MGINSARLYAGMALLECLDREMSSHSWVHQAIAHVPLPQHTALPQHPFHLHFAQQYTIQGNKHDTCSYL